MTTPEIEAMEVLRALAAQRVAVKKEESAKLWIKKNSQQ
jgi:hypothetical protein